MVEPSGLPDRGWSAREPVAEDAESIAQLMNDVTIAEAGIAYVTVEDVRDIVTAPRNEETLPDTVVLDDRGAAIGYTQVTGASTEEVHVIVFAAPSVWGRGLSAWLIRREEARVAERWPSGGVPLRLSCFTGNDAAVRLFEALEFEHVRTFWAMEIALDEAPPAPVVDEGITIRTFDRERDERAVHDALAEAFEDHWGRIFSPFERWVHDDIEGEGSRFDPTLWFIAFDDDEVVGVATCTAGSAQDEDAGQVGMLGVRRAWRRRGVALALLHTAFAEFRRRGLAKAQLGVDASNPTGATRLYERAGMHSVRSWEIWEKRVGGRDTVTS
jgi:mycothiol synthase